MTQDIDTGRLEVAMQRLATAERILSENGRLITGRELHQVRCCVASARRLVTEEDRQYGGLLAEKRLCDAAPSFTGQMRAEGK